jgi:hypothetical protein
MARRKRLKLFVCFSLLLVVLVLVLVDCRRVSGVAWQEGSDQSVTVRRLISLSAPPSEIRFVWIEPLRMWAGETEITMGQLYVYDRSCTEYSYYERAPGFSWEWPALNVTDRSAEGFARWLNRNFRDHLPSGYEFRLPTTSEWKAVARCGTDRKYPWGDEWPPVPMADGHLPNLMGEDQDDRLRTATPDERQMMHATEGDNFLGIPYRPEAFIPGYRDGFPGPCPVRLSGRNEWGLYGVGGNAQEWCLEPRTGTLVFKGCDYMTFGSDYAEISHILTMAPRSSPFGGLDRRSDNRGGFRVVVGKNLVPAGKPSFRPPSVVKKSGDPRNTEFDKWEKDE